MTSKPGKDADEGKQDAMRVLVVDDSKAMRTIVIRTLRQSAIDVDDVREAADGVEALAVLVDYTADLILCDWNMPNMNGIEFLTELRRRAVTTPFGFVTSESNPAMRQLGLATGADFVITKPFDGDPFTEVIRSLVM